MYRHITIHKCDRVHRCITKDKYYQFNCSLYQIGISVIGLLKNWGTSYTVRYLTAFHNILTVYFKTLMLSILYFYSTKNLHTPPTFEPVLYNHLSSLSSQWCHLSEVLVTSHVCFQCLQDVILISQCAHHQIAVGRQLFWQPVQVVGIVSAT